MPFKVMEVVKIYSLLQIGVSYQDAINMPAGLSDSLIELHKEIKDYEADEMEKSSKNMDRGNR